jgi:photosystem II stability/assembly factor-like uncharacterized protein
MKAFIINSFLVLFSFTLSAQWITLPFSGGLPNQAINFINKDTGFVSCGVFQGPPNIYIHNMLYKTKDGGYSWQTVFDDYTSTPISQLNFFNENFGVYRRWQDVMMKTYQGGLSGYTILSGGQTSAGDKFQVFDSTKYLFSGIDNVRFTTDGGLSWTTKNLSTYIPNNWGVTNAQFANLKNGFICAYIYTLTPSASTEFKFYKTTDSCQTLQVVYSKIIPGPLNPDFIDLKFINDSTAMMLNNDLVLKVSNFGNTTFDTIHKFTAPEKAFRMAVKDNIIIISGNYGSLLTSVDSGQTFQMSSVNPTPIEFSIADSKRGVIYASTVSNTVIKLSGLTTSLKKQEEFMTYIYPNPAKEYIHISYDDVLKKEVEIFNLTGSLIKSFALNPNYSHTNKLMIDELNSGCYILKIKSLNKTEYLKFIKE